MIDTEVIHVTIDRSLYTVLVVDDNPATRYSTGRVIRAAGFRIAEAGSGTEALAQVANGVSAVVLDVHLPDIDGFEVCRMIRADAATASLPVVHLSAQRIRDEDRVTGLNAGADGYLVHPVEPAVLVATLQALIRARTAEDRMRRSEQRFRAIYDLAPCAIALVDEEGRFTDVNAALLRVLGRRREELIDRPVREFVAPEARERYAREAARPLAERTPWRGEMPLVHADGHSVPIEWNLSPHVEPGMRIAVGIDMSERYALEQGRRDVLEREQAARQLAEHHSRTKDDFIAVLSHELRTPLNAILGWVHLLKVRGIASDEARGLDAIERNVKTQARIISDILDVSRINSGKLRLDREWADPAELVTTSLQALAASWRAKHLQVETRLDAAHAPAWLDPARFQQICWNLMTNAVKFTPEGGRIEVSLVREGPRLLLAVQDHGQGIAPAFLPHLFDRFTQGDAPGNRRHGGLGLGLSIVKHLAELHGGHVVASSDGPGQGTCMYVDLPVEPAAAPTGEPEAEGQRDAEEPVVEGLDLLVVEDDREAAEMIAMVLMDRGARVRTAGDFDAALQELQQAWPDVLVSDIGLPGSDGYALARRVRELERARGTARLPMIALTAFGRTQDRQRSVAAGFDRHLAKPLSPHELLHAIAACRAAKAG